MTDDVVAEFDQLLTACTLPSADRPLRVAEFRAVIALVSGAERDAPTRLLLSMPFAPGREETVRDLAARETSCCSFFEFRIRTQDAAILLEVTVPPGYVGVLDAMAEHAERTEYPEPLFCAPSTT